MILFFNQPKLKMFLHQDSFTKLDQNVVLHQLHKILKDNAIDENWIDPVGLVQLLKEASDIITKSLDTRIFIINLNYKSLGQNIYDKFIDYTDLIMENTLLEFLENDDLSKLHDAAQSFHRSTLIFDNADFNTLLNLMENEPIITLFTNPLEEKPMTDEEYLGILMHRKMQSTETKYDWSHTILDTNIMFDIGSVHPEVLEEHFVMANQCLSYMWSVTEDGRILMKNMYTRSDEAGKIYNNIIPITQEEFETLDPIHQTIQRELYLNHSSTLSIEATTELLNKIDSVPLISQRLRKYLDFIHLHYILKSCKPKFFENVYVRTEYNFNTYLIFQIYDVFKLIGFHDLKNIQNANTLEMFAIDNENITNIENNFLSKIFYNNIICHLGWDDFDSLKPTLMLTKGNWARQKEGDIYLDGRRLQHNAGIRRISSIDFYKTYNILLKDVYGNKIPDLFITLCYQKQKFPEHGIFNSIFDEITTCFLGPDYQHDHILLNNIKIPVVNQQIQVILSDYGYGVLHG